VSPGSWVAPSEGFASLVGSVADGGDILVFWVAVLAELESWDCEDESDSFNRRCKEQSRGKARAIQIKAVASKSASETWRELPRSGMSKAIRTRPTPQYKGAIRPVEIIGVSRLALYGIDGTRGSEHVEWAAG
jgi:hypothetical protein